LTDKVPELLVSIRMGLWMQTFDITSGTNVLLVEQSPNRFTTQLCACLLIQRLLDFLQALTDPAATGLRFTSDIILNNFR
jgi:hypothetical protein